MPFSVSSRSQRALLVLSVVACVQICSVLAKSTALGDKPIYVSSRTAQVYAKHSHTLTLVNYTHAGNGNSRMLDSAEALQNKN